MARQHYNSPTRLSAPWTDAGVHETRTAGKRRLWLHPPMAEGGYWTCAVAGAGSTSGDTAEQALERGKNW